MIEDTQNICAKMPLKGELLRRMSQRYPGLEVEAIEVVTGVQSLAKSLSGRMNQQMAAYGLTEGKFYVLAYLFSEELLGHCAPAPSDIADHLGVTRATVTGLLDGLEREGYLERCHDVQDRRALSILITDKTRQFMDEFVPSSARNLRALTAVLDETEQRTLVTLLAKLDTRLREMNGM